MNCQLNSSQCLNKCFYSVDACTIILNNNDKHGCLFLQMFRKLLKMVNTFLLNEPQALASQPGSARQQHDKAHARGMCGTPLCALFTFLKEWWFSQGNLLFHLHSRCVVACSNVCACCLLRRQCSASGASWTKATWLCAFLRGWALGRKQPPQHLQPRPHNTHHSHRNRRRRRCSWPPQRLGARACAIQA